MTADTEFLEVAAPSGKSQCKRLVPLLQSESMDCGTACTVMLVRHYGAGANVADFRDKLTTERAGTNLARIADVLEEAGFQSFAFEVETEELPSIREPFITGLADHFVVVEETTGGFVKFVDPSIGRRRLSLEAFSREWGRLCIFAKPSGDAYLVAQNDARTLKLLPLMRRFIGVTLTSVVASLMFSALTIGSTQVTRVLLDDIVPSKNVSLLWTLGLALLIVNVMGLSLGVFRDFLVAKTAGRFHVDFSVEVYRHLFSLPYLRVASKTTGDILGRMSDAAAIRTFITQHFTEVIVNILFFVAALVFVVVVDTRLATLCLFGGFIAVAISWFSTRYLYEKNNEIFVQSARGDQLLIEHTRNLLSIKTFAAEGLAVSKWKRQLEKNNTLFLGLFRTTRLLDSAEQLVGTLSVSALTLYGAHIVMRGELTIGQLVSVGILYSMVVSPMQGLAGLLSQFQAVRASRNRLEEVLEVAPEKTAGRSAALVREGAIELSNVSFAYGKHAPNVLSDLSLVVPKHEIVGLVGPSGSGKTTFSLLLNRLLDTYEGTVKIDDIDIRDLDLKSLRRAIGVVTQEPALIAGSILENICLGDPSPDKAKAAQAATLAQAHEFIDSLPLGYGFLVGQGGFGLSGGQRQRIAIARALYSDPKILVFDEMTSSLDRETERNLLASLRPILCNRTCIIISHRVSSLSLCDRILLLHEGQIAEQGTLGELRTAPLFQKLMLD